MLQAKEFKGDARHPDIQDMLNDFFRTFTDAYNVYNISYGNALLPSKDKDGKITYIIVSTALVFYDDGVYESDGEEDYEE